MKQQLFLRTYLVLTLINIVACAPQHDPIATQKVTDASGEVTTLMQATVSQGVPATLAQLSYKEYDRFADKVRNTNYLVMVDFTQHSRNLRMYVVNRATGAVDQLAVAHGAGSDPNDTGTPTYFSNVPDTHMSSLGSYLIQEIWKSPKYGNTMRLDGLESTNNNVRDRAIIMHPSAYVNDGSPKQGRSWGCTAVPTTWIKTLLDRLHDGSFMYVYGKNLAPKIWSAPELLRAWNLLPRSQWPSESEDAPIEGE